MAVCKLDQAVQETKVTKLYAFDGLKRIDIQEAAAGVFGPGGGNRTSEPAVDVKTLHAKIGELTLENDFLERALSKAGLLSAKR